MFRKILLLFLIMIPLRSYAMDQSITNSQLVLIKNDSPLIAFRIWFQTGSANDPAGKEGLATLTASLLSDASTKQNDYQKILELLFPMSASYSTSVDKEMTIISGVVHKDNLMPFYQLLRDAVLSPAFKQEDFDRLKTDQLNFVTKTLRFNNDEALGKETLSSVIYKNHPYGHPNEGTEKAVQSITIEDVKDFYSKNYTRNNVVIGIAGDYPNELVEQVKKDFASLPSGSAVAATKIPVPAKVDGLNVVMVEKPVQGTAISFGFPISVNRSSEDFYALMVMNAWLGQHRSQFSHLYQVMRAARGLNYGDYSYIEFYPLPYISFLPRPNYARHQQFFEIWIRPVQNQNRHFALRQAIRELQILIDKGMTEQSFQLSKGFLLNFTTNLAQSNSDLLGYSLDDKFYGLSRPFLEQVKTKVTALTLDDVNRAIKKYLNTQNMVIAVVTQDAAAFQKALLDNAPSPIQYDSQKPDMILQEDKEIMVYPLPIKPDKITVIPAEKMFQ
jgi:zinc protease